MHIIVVAGENSKDGGDRETRRAIDRSSQGELIRAGTKVVRTKRMLGRRDVSKAEAP